MRGPLAALLVVLAAVAGGAIGGLAGFAMDRFPALGLSPEGFWNTDPENLWACSILLGAALAAAAVALALARRRRPA
jgi:hypothetical protein